MPEGRIEQGLSATTMRAHLNQSAREVNQDGDLLQKVGPEHVDTTAAGIKQALERGVDGKDVTPDMQKMALAMVSQAGADSDLVANMLVNWAQQ